jgi:NTE family protein
LDRYNNRPDVVAGCCIGAVIGADDAFGYSVEALIRLMRAQRTSSLFALRRDGEGLGRSETLRAYLRRTLHDCTFADLPTPFYAICTDLVTGKEVVLHDGPVVEAVLASSALPGVFAPVEWRGRLLVDGGLRNNVPVSALVHNQADYTIAVRLHEEADPLAPPPPQAPAAGVALWAERLARTFSREAGSREAGSREGANKDGGRTPNGLAVVSRALDIVVGQLENYRLQAYPPDVLITPEVADVPLLSLSEEKEEIFRRGVEAAEARGDQLAEIARCLEAAS